MCSDAVCHSQAVAASHIPSRPGFLCNAELCWRRDQTVADLCVWQAKVAGSSMLCVKGVLKIGTGYQSLLKPAQRDRLEWRAQLPSVRKAMFKVDLTL